MNGLEVSVPLRGYLSHYELKDEFIVDEVTFPSPYGVIYLITSSLKGQYLCGLSRCFAAEKKNLGFFEDFFAFSRKATF